jgi:hypothetical protein
MDVRGAPRTRSRSHRYVFRWSWGHRSMGIANMLVQAADIDLGAAEAARPSGRDLRRQLHAGIVHSVFSCRPVALVAPGLEVRFRARRQEGAPSRFKAGASDFEREAAAPFPLVNIDGDAGTPADRPDTDVTIEDAPVVLAIGGTAAGELGHRP